MSTATFTEAEQAVVALKDPSIRMAELCDEALQALYNNNGVRDMALEDMGFDDASPRDFLKAMNFAMDVYHQRDRTEKALYRQSTKRALEAEPEAAAAAASSEPAAKKSKAGNRVWILEMQCKIDVKCLIGVFSSEAKLDAFAAAHDQSIYADVPNDDFFFVTFFRKRIATLNQRIDNPIGTPIYGAQYASKTRDWIAARAARSEAKKQKN